MGRVVLPGSGESEKPFVVGTYTGSGWNYASTRQTIGLEFTPSVVIVYRKDGAQALTVGNSLQLFGGMATANAAATSQKGAAFIQVVEKGFLVYSDLDSSPREPICANDGGVVYYYIAFR